LWQYLPERSETIPLPFPRSRFLGEEQVSDRQEAIDPDVWTVLSLVVNTVAMVAQLAGLRGNAAPKGLNFHSTGIAYEKIRDELENAIRNCEKLIRILSGARGETLPPLDAPFRFGQSRTFLPISDFRRYSELIQQIALNAGNLSVWTLNLIQNDPGFAEEIGNRIMMEAGNVQQRINDLFQKSLTNQDVFDECLLMLRTFNQLLGRFELRRN
jgi:hypothetical protein